MHRKLFLLLVILTTTCVFSILASQHNIGYGQSVINLNGRWTAGGPQSAVISVSSSSITIDMSAFGRPAAHGSILDSSTITVTFPDDRTYTGKLELPNTIKWSNGSVWKKV